MLEERKPPDDSNSQKSVESEDSQPHESQADVSEAGFKPFVVGTEDPSQLRITTKSWFSYKEEFITANFKHDSKQTIDATYKQSN